MTRHDSCRGRLSMGSAADDGEVWSGSVPADRDWLTTDDPVKAMQHAYCPQARWVLCWIFGGVCKARALSINPCVDMLLHLYLGRKKQQFLVLVSMFSPIPLSARTVISTLVLCIHPTLRKRNKTKQENTPVRLNHAAENLEVCMVVGMYLGMYLLGRDVLGRDVFGRDVLGRYVFGRDVVEVLL